MVLLTTIIFILIGTAAAREPDIDINRIRLLPREPHPDHPNSHERRSIPEKVSFRTNDYDDSGSEYLRLRAPIHVYPSPNNAPSTNPPLKVYQPREDPRLFYQSEAYLKENNGQNVNHEVTYVYPGRDAIRADGSGQRSAAYNMNNREQNYLDNGSNLCVRCPHDRTLVARPGSDQVLLQAPRLVTCSGHKAPRNYHFVHMYGPRFGSLLNKGSHLLIGRIMFKNKNMHYCKMQIHVVVQECPIPKYLKARCETSKICNFTCRNPKLELQGPSSLICGSNMKWTQRLPVCRARTSCEPPPPPEHGLLSCKGATAGSGPGLIEGSKCRVRCSSGWRGYPRPITVCRRGAWTNELMCLKTIRN